MPTERTNPVDDRASRIAAFAHHASIWWIVLIVGAIAGIYANSLTAPFIFDDEKAVINNPSIRHLWPPGTVWRPPRDATGATGRPVVNLSLALNHAFGGLDVRGYHLFNIAIHALAAVTLFGIVRRTLALPRWSERWSSSATSLAGLAALLWAVHPLQTESVTCVVQRSELLGGLFLLLTLYCFIRALSPEAGRRWPVLCVTACALGIASKEFVASAPVIALLYDRTFVAGSFAAAWRARRSLYVALVAPLAWLAWLVHDSAGRGGTVGFGLGVSAWDYLLTQCQAIVLYLRLAFWPHPLVLDYGDDLVRNLATVWPQALLLVALGVATAVGVRRRTCAGFAGVWFFALLAPSSSVVPLVTQTAAEHRMYLPLAAIVVPAVIGIDALNRRRGLVALSAVAVLFGFLTVRRNHDYRSAETIWTDTVEKLPANPRAHVHLGQIFAATGNGEAAIAHYEAALRLRPEHPDAHLNLADVLSRFGRFKEAGEQLKIALPARIDSAPARVMFATILDRLGRHDEAMQEYGNAVRLDPGLAEAHSNLGDALLRRQQPAAAIVELETALRLKPGYAAAHYQLATALAQVGRLAEGRRHFEAGRSLDPRDAVALANWAGALAAAGPIDEALTHYESALALRPDLPEVHYNYASALAGRQRYDDAIRHYRTAIQLQPGYAAAHNNLGNALLVQQRAAEAVPSYHEAIRLQPDNAAAHNNLGLALAGLGRLGEAAEHFAEAVRLNPGYTEARENLARARAQLRGE